MSGRAVRSVAPTLARVGAVALLTACAADPPTAAEGRLALGLAQGAGPKADKVALCHRPESGGQILEVGAPALADHAAHGDYVTTLRVSHAAVGTDDGVHFARIGDALGAARDGRLARGELTSAACRITIVVDAGTYGGTAGVASGDLEQFPLIVDVPDVTLRGALEMATDDVGRATGLGRGDGETTLAPVDPLPFVNFISTPLIIANAHPGGSAGDGLIVEGFVLRSGHDPAVDLGGQGVLVVRAERVTIQGNRFEGGFTESIDVRGASADVLQNHLSGTAGTCDVCLAGPGRYRAIGNRLLTGGIPGIGASGVVGIPMPSGVEPLAIPATAETWAEIANNEVSDHMAPRVGVGLRVDAVGVGAPDVHNTLHVDMHDNVLHDNRFGIIVHAAFPVPGTTRRSDVDVTIRGNTIERSCQAKLLVSFARHTTGLGLDNRPYLLNSTFRLSLDGVSWSEAWYAHPAGFGNTLEVDGQTIANGSHHAYAATGCPGLQAPAE